MAKVYPIEVVEKLGAECAYRPKTIEVRKSFYDQIPEELREDFKAVMNSAREAYERRVGDAKASGIPPKSGPLKKDTFKAVVGDWMQAKGITVKEEPQVRVVRASKPSIAIDRKKVKLDDVVIDPERVKQLFDNNNDIDRLDDSKPAMEKTEVDELFEEEVAAPVSENLSFKDDDFEDIL